MEYHANECAMSRSVVRPDIWVDSMARLEFSVDVSIGNVACRSEYLSS
jgi:hypothetical protein